MYVAGDREALIAGSQWDLKPFNLIRPRSLPEAVSAMAAEPDPVPYAGGTDMVAALREARRIGSLVWLRDLDELRGVREADGHLSIGALLTHADGANNEALQAIPGFAAAWSRIATVRIRWTATIGGNLMARRTRYEMSILLTALDARLRFATAEGEVLARPLDIWTGDVPARALLARIELPLDGAPRLDYERSMRPTTTQALCIRDDAGARRGRAVIATEYLPPFAFDVDPGAGGGAAGIAETAFEALPADFQDPAVGNTYLRKAGAVFLKRQMLRLGAADA
jgi:carbon-monoxide dehydrogenase medium subunit